MSSHEAAKFPALSEDVCKVVGDKLVCQAPLERNPTMLAIMGMDSSTSFSTSIATRSGERQVASEGCVYRDGFLLYCS